MPHYALLNNNIVVQVVVGSGDDLESYYAELMGLTCKRTSYNTRGGVHVGGGTPFRKNYAGIGYAYDAERDAFIPPKPFPSWVLDEAFCLWGAPVAMPDDGNMYNWNESTLGWEAV